MLFKRVTDDDSSSNSIVTILLKVETGANIKNLMIFLFFCFHFNLKFCAGSGEKRKAGKAVGPGRVYYVIH